MSAANPNPMEKPIVSVLVVANAGGGSPLPCGVLPCIIGVSLSQGYCLCSLLCFLDNRCFHRVSRVICRMGMVSMAGSGAVGTA
jgi:hypothetical protein